MDIVTPKIRQTQSTIHGSDGVVSNQPNFWDLSIVEKSFKLIPHGFILTSLSPSHNIISNYRLRFMLFCLFLTCWNKSDVTSIFALSLLILLCSTVWYPLLVRSFQLLFLYLYCLKVSSLFLSLFSVLLVPFGLSRCCPIVLSLLW